MTTFARRAAQSMAFNRMKSGPRIPTSRGSGSGAAGAGFYSEGCKARKASKSISSVQVMIASERNFLVGKVFAAGGAVSGVGPHKAKRKESMSGRNGCKSGTA